MIYLKLIDYLRFVLPKSCSFQVKVYLKLLLILFFWGYCSPNSTGQQKKYVFTAKKMGSPFSLTFFCADSTFAQLLAKNAFKIVDSVEASMSDYNVNSEINRLTAESNTHVATKISDDLLNILLESKKANSLTNGAFDISIGSLTKLWRKVKLEKKIDKNELNLALDKTGFGHIKIDSLAKTATIIKKGVTIDLGGIAKGFAADKVLNFFKENGIISALIDAAGNMAIGGKPLDNSEWKIALEMRKSEYKMLKINNLAVSTSGDAYQHIFIKGKKYSHILDPKTGLGLRNGRQVTVISKNAMMADWLSTSLCILPINKGLKLARKQASEALILKVKKNKLRIKMTPNFKNYWIN